MSHSVENYDPYPFTQNDLQVDTLVPGVEHTLARFFSWRDHNSGAVDDYLIECQDELNRARSEFGFTARFGRAIFPSRNNEFKKNLAIEELEIFGIRNMAEVLDRGKIIYLYKQAEPHRESVRKLTDQTRDLSEVLAHTFFPPYQSVAVDDARIRLKRLYRILPEKIIQNGSMGKVARTLLGVGTIAAFDLLDATDEEKREHINRVIYGALVYAELYALIDDTLQDSTLISRTDRDRYNKIILEGLRTGELIDVTGLPDNPVTGELEQLFRVFIQHYPIKHYPHLYQAAESMYIAQSHDAELTMETTQTTNLRYIYPDALIKSGMARVVANSIARRAIPPDFYGRCLNSMFVNQLRDDLVDYGEDSQNRRITAFTHPNNLGDTNPLYDMFAYDAYIASILYKNVSPILARSQVSYIVPYLSSCPDKAHELLRKYGNESPESLRQFILQASQLSHSVANHLASVDDRLKDAIAAATTNRDQKDIDPRTFIWDRMQLMNQIITQFIESKKADGKNQLFEIMKYSLESGGKHLRPTLTMMLAESLDVDLKTITPLLLAGELFQTASLLFDDLPSQDDSATRRGKPTAHTVYGVADTELTGIFMLLEGIHVLQDLKTKHAPEDVLDLTHYTTHAIQQIAVGQNIDLDMRKMDKKDIALDDLLRMYHLKTAVAIEAALVPLMILQKRAPKEIESIKQYAHHAGLVFQIRDDMLDASGKAEVVGKDVQKDLINLVQLFGEERAQELMEHHLKEAITACQNLPFNTSLLRGMAEYFASRKR